MYGRANGHLRPTVLGRLGGVDLIIKRMYDPKCVPHFDFIELSEDSIRTKGNRYKLTQRHCHYDLRKYTYTNRIYI